MPKCVISSLPITHWFRSAILFQAILYVVAIGRVEDCVFEGNTAPNGLGGGIHLLSSRMQLENTIIVNNDRGVSCVGFDAEMVSNSNEYTVVNNTIEDFTCLCRACLCAPTNVLDLTTNDGRGVRLLHLYHKG